MASSLRDEVEELLQGRRYDPEIIPILEEYVKEQTTTGMCDSDANLALLKLYQFYPDIHNHGVVVQVLALALTVLPATDFLCAQYLIPDAFQSVEPIPKLISLLTCLDEGRYVDFWTQYKATGEGVISVANFESSIQQFMVGVIKQTYITIKKTVLMELLNLDEEGLDALIDEEDFGVTADDRVKFPATVENQPRPAKVEEQLTFRLVAPALFRALR